MPSPTTCVGIRLRGRCTKQDTPYNVGSVVQTAHHDGEGNICYVSGLSRPVWTLDIVDGAIDWNISRNQMGIAKYLDVVLAFWCNVPRAWYRLRSGLKVSCVGHCDPGNGRRMSTKRCSVIPLKWRHLVIYLKDVILAVHVVQVYTEIRI